MIFKFISLPTGDSSTFSGEQQKTKIQNEAGVCRSRRKKKKKKEFKEFVDGASTSIYTLNDKPASFQILQLPQGSDFTQAATILYLVLTLTGNEGHSAGSSESVSTKLAHHTNIIRQSNRFLRLLKYAGNALLAVCGTAGDVRAHFVALTKPAQAFLSECMMATLRRTWSRDGVYFRRQLLTLPFLLAKKKVGLPARNTNPTTQQ